MVLPIDGMEDEIVERVRTNQVTVLVGATGSGKTTQLPQMLHRAGFAEHGMIGITEPRRVAAVSTANYVRQQSGLDTRVGYSVRHDHHVAPGTEILFATDGMILREMLRDPLLSKYSVIVVDEAHERSVNIDLILGLLKQVLKQREDFKVVVASATIDQEKFSRYFGGAPVIEVPGRTFPVTISYGDRDYHPDDFGSVELAAAEMVAKIHQTKPPGDILIFAPGAEEINRIIRDIEDKELNGLEILGAHGSMSPEDQMRIFTRFPDKRKVIVATNMAETSITIDGVVYVIDPGFIKQMVFDPSSGIQSLKIVPHSQAGCDQRAGRAGRNQPGECYRLYTEASFRKRQRFTIPEIQRSSLASVILSMEAMKITDIENFDFVDRPDPVAFHNAYEELIALGAINANGIGLTELGVRMAKLPLEPRIARMVLAAEEYGCVDELVTIAALLEVGHVLNRPRDKELDADYAHAQFKVYSSDMLTSLKIWDEYCKAKADRDWCFTNFVNSRKLWEVKNIREQLLRILEREGIEIATTTNKDNILKAVATGLVRNLVQLVGKYDYAYLFQDNFQQAFIHPGSAVYRINPSFAVCTQMVATTKLYARGVSTVKVEWLPEIAPNHFFFGPGVILQVNEGNGQVEVEYAIYSRQLVERPIGYKRVSVTKAEAAKIQDENIQAARKSGLVKLVFAERPQSGFYSIGRTLVAYYQGLEYTNRSYSVQVGVPYYCTLDEACETAAAVFQVFPSLEPTPPVVSEQQKVKAKKAESASNVAKPEAPAALDLSKLAAWSGGKVTV